MASDAKLMYLRSGIITSGTRGFAGDGTSSGPVAIGHEGEEGVYVAHETGDPADLVRGDKSSVEHSLDEFTISSATSLRCTVQLVF